MNVNMWVKGHVTFMHITTSFKLGYSTGDVTDKFIKRLSPCCALNTWMIAASSTQANAKQKGFQHES